MRAANNVKDPALLPFRRCRLACCAYLDHTRQLLSALNGATTPMPSGDGATTLLTLPNNLDNNNNDNGDNGTNSQERRPTSTYAVRPPSKAELEALLDPSRCNCRLVPGGGQPGADACVAVMYRVAWVSGDGGGENILF